MSLDANQIMTNLLDVFEQGNAPIGGWYIEAALRKLPWNKRFNSLKAFDALIASHRSKRGFADPEKFLTEPASRHTVLLLSAYLAKVLQHSTGSSIRWFHHRDFVAANPDAHQHIPYLFGTSMVLQLGSHWIFPISIVCDQLLDEHTTTAFSQVVLHIILREQLSQNTDTTSWMHLMAQSVLTKNADNNEVAYANLIGAHTWDYSRPSLDELNLLLQSVKNTQVFTENTWNEQPEQAHFLLWVAAYLAASIANIAKQPLHWWDHQEASELMQEELPSHLATTRVAQIGQHLYFILGYLSDYLMNKTQTSVIEYAQFILAQSPKPAYAHLKHEQTTAIEGHKPLKLAMLNAGHTAAYMVYQYIKSSVSDTPLMLPTLFDGQKFHHVMDKGITAESYWNEQRHNHPFISFAHETHAYLAREKTAAIQIDTSVKDDDGTQYTISIIVPYYTIQDYRGLQILRPFFTSSSVEEFADVEALSPYFFQGIQQFEQQNKPFWKTYYHGESIQ